MPKTIVIFVALFLSVGSAQASISVQTLRPSTNSTYSIIEDAFLQLQPRKTEAFSKPILIGSAQYGYVHNPLIEYDAQRINQTNVLVSSIHTLDLNASYYIQSNLEVSFSIPLSLTKFSTQSNEIGLGDTRVQGKYRIPMSMKDMAFAIIPEVIIPTGSRTLLLSNDSWGLGLLAAYEIDIQMFRIALNAGYRHSANATFSEIDYRDLLPLSFGIHSVISDQWGANLELIRSIALPSNLYNNPSDFYLGAHYQPNSLLTLQSGISIPTLGSGGSGDFRFLINAKYNFGSPL